MPTNSGHFGHLFSREERCVVGHVLPLVLHLVLGEALGAPRTRRRDPSSVLHRVVRLQEQNVITTEDKRSPGGL